MLKVTHSDKPSHFFPDGVPDIRPFVEQQKKEEEAKRLKDKDGNPVVVVEPPADL